MTKNIDMTKWDSAGDVLRFDNATSWEVALSNNLVILRISYATSQEHLDAVHSKKELPERTQVCMTAKTAKELGQELIRYA